MIILSLNNNKGFPKLSFITDISLKLIFSLSSIYIFGMIWLGFLIGWDKPIFKLGAQPFLLAELFKVLLLLALTPSLLKVRKILKII